MGSVSIAPGGVSAYSVYTTNIPHTQLDHTYVEAINPITLANILYGCFGGYHGGALVPGVGAFNVEEQYAEICVNGHAGSGLTVFDRVFHLNHNAWNPGDTCSMLYLLHGVCHNCANRITSTGPGQITMPVGTPVGGIHISYLLFGPMGRFFPAFQGNVTAMAAMLGTVLEKASESSVDDFTEELLHLDEIEMDEKEKMLRRLHIFKKYTLPNDEIDIPALENSIKKMEIVREELEKQAMQKGEQTSPEQQKKMNESYDIMLCEFNNILGAEKFRKMFGLPYVKEELLFPIVYGSE